jgi:hypothetical protein
MSKKSISKKLLMHYLSDSPTLWAMEGRAFLKSAKMLQNAPIKLENIPLLKGKRPVSAPEVCSSSYKDKISCFLYAISIELLLKTMYSAIHEKNNDKNTEKRGHDIKGLLKYLLEHEILNTEQINNDAVNLSQLLLSWYGRYYMPKANQIDSVLTDCFETNADGLLTPKINIDRNSIKNLQEFAELLSGLIPDSQSFIDEMVLPIF